MQSPHAHPSAGGPYDAPMGNGDIGWAWDDPRWVESDTAWAGGCRWLQSWWRAHELRAEPGPLSASNERLVCSMLPLDCGTEANFLDGDIAAAVRTRLSEGEHSGIITEDRLYRNLLSSQPACFNLFGPFVNCPNDLLGWVRTLDPAAAEVRAVRFEWAPDRTAHFGGGSAFDAFLDYATGSGGPRFIGVECKYAENLAQSSIRVRDVYVDFTNGSPHWQTGAAQVLNEKRHRQFWLNTLLAQSLVERGAGLYEAGFVAVVALGADTSAVQATDAVRNQLVEPDRWLRWSPYESVLAAVTGHDEWKQRFTRRYVDFEPVAHLLGRRDPRRTV